MSKDNPFRKAIASRQQAEAEEVELSVNTSSPTQSPPTAVEPVAAAKPKKRGRPATGKRSDEAWIGRTYYVQRETDLDIESELLDLKRKGIEIDKSELVDKLLAAWVQWRQGEDSEFLLSEISPIRKAKN